MNAALDGVDDPFLEAAGQALRAAGDGPDPLTALGWWDLLPDLGDRDVRAAALALFRAHGRELSSSVALGALLAQPFRASAPAAPGTLVATIASSAPGRGARLLVVGDVRGKVLLIDRPGHGADLVAASDLELRPLAPAGGLAIHEVPVGGVEPDRSARLGVIAEREAAPARVRARFLGRLAVAWEILGAAESALALAVTYAGHREQFGRPIGTFQAVRHLLAWARTDCAALGSVAALATSLDELAPARYDEVVKALAGRNGRRICEQALQVLGAVGFTTEHRHHAYHGRVLALDALLGSSAELTHGLGAWVRETGTDPSVPAATLWSSPDRS